MPGKISHIGIAVHNIDEATPFYRDVLGMEFEGTEVVAEQKVKVTYYRGGEQRESTVHSTEFPAEQVDRELWRRVGFEVTEITPALARSYNLPARDGVAIRRVRENSPAYAIGLDGGDVLLNVDGRPIATLGDLHQALVPAFGRDSFTLMVQRGRHRYRGVLEF